MRIAFVGVKRRYKELDEDYRHIFTQFHLELPYYYARDGLNDVFVTTVDLHGVEHEFPGGNRLLHVKEEQLAQLQDIDVVVHWRRWFPELYRPDAINVINCQDHSFGADWQESARTAFLEGKLYGILCFPTWHRRNLLRECPWLPSYRAIGGLTLGVDTSVYRPADDKDPHDMLWASDPGRGIERAVGLAIELFRRDRRFRLHVCMPDYARGTVPSHPAIVWRGNIPNGPELWHLFGRTGILPYTSTFMEPSSRAHRQAMAAGSLVLYPPDMGSPSELIQGDRTGIVEPIRVWADRIQELVQTGRWREIGGAARAYAESESWYVQTQRFNDYFNSLPRSR